MTLIRADMLPRLRRSGSCFGSSRAGSETALADLSSTCASLDPGLQLMKDACVQLEQRGVLDELRTLLRSETPLPAGVTEAISVWLILAEREYTDHSVDRFFMAIADFRFVDGLRPGAFDTRSVPQIAIERASPFIRDLRCKPPSCRAAAALAQWAEGVHTFVAAYIYPQQHVT